MMDLQEAIKRHDSGVLTTEQFTQIVKENQEAGIFWVPTGKNQSRFGFLHHHVSTLKGRFFQAPIKKHILSIIDRIHTNGLTDSDISYLRVSVNTIHFSWRKGYDRDAFVYADPRLKALDTFIKQYISTKMGLSQTDRELASKIIDIVLGMAKEDSYYRARLIDFVDKFRKTYSIDDTISGQLNQIEMFTRSYISKDFAHCPGYKDKFMNQLLDIVLSETEDTTIIPDLVNNFIVKFPEMLLAPGEVDNIRRWH